MFRQKSFPIFHFERSAKKTKKLCFRTPCSQHRHDGVAVGGGTGGAAGEGGAIFRARLQHDDGVQGELATAGEGRGDGPAGKD
eukprot:gene18509-biopygen21959